MLTPVFSKAGVAWLRSALAAAAPGTRDHGHLAERVERVSGFMGGHVSMYSGKRSRRPAQWALAAG